MISTSVDSSGQQRGSAEDHGPSLWNLGTRNLSKEPLRVVCSSKPAAVASRTTPGRSSRASWGEVKGSKVELVTLRNASGVEAAILTYGCVLQSVLLPVGGGGEKVDVVLGYDTLQEYATGKSNYGSIVGRYANRTFSSR